MQERQMMSKETVTQQIRAHTHTHIHTHTHTHTVTQQIRAHTHTHTHTHTHRDTQRHRHTHPSPYPLLMNINAFPPAAANGQNVKNGPDSTAPVAPPRRAIQMRSRRRLGRGKGGTL